MPHRLTHVIISAALAATAMWNAAAFAQGPGDKVPPPVIRDRVPPPVISATTVSIFFGGPGGGTVSTPTKLRVIVCSADCTLGMPGASKTITLTAQPDGSSVCAGWGGSCSGTNPTCSLTFGASTQVIAYFRSAFKTVAAGAYHTCALRPAAGDVFCWGRNTDGQIGTGGGFTNSLTPSAVTGITSAVAIAAGGYHTCALLVGGTISCWGNNDKGQIGSTGSSSSTPTVVPGITAALAVTTGGYHTCAVLAGGSASCWGRNDDGQLGVSTPFSVSAAPVPVTLTTVGPLSKMIAAGGFHTCAIVAADSTVFCWGLNGNGQLGIGDLTTTIPPKVQVDPGCNSGFAEGCIITTTFLKATSIAASMGVGPLHWGAAPLGGYFTVALDSTGQDWGWGDNHDGEVFPLTVTPLSLSTDRPFAMKDPFLPNPAVLKISAGAYHTCMEHFLAGVICRGNNNNGQLGVPSGTPPPTSVPTLAFPVDVAAGGYHSCAVVADTTRPPTGAIACWGENGDGQVTGTPTPGTDVTTPFVLPFP